MKKNFKTYNRPATTPSASTPTPNATAIHYNRTVQAWLDEPRRNLRGARITTKLIREIEA